VLTAEGEIGVRSAGVKGALKENELTTGRIGLILRKIDLEAESIGTRVF
jgi:hypothetical protein